MSLIREIYDRSPLRVLDRSIHGGLGRGNIGVVCAGHGAGKTAFLVSVALDHLMSGDQVLHVAVDQPVDRIRNYYDEIFAEMAREEHLERASEARLALEKNRRIHAYQASTFGVEPLAHTIEFLRQHTDLHPDLVVVDGYDWERGAEGDLVALRRIARDHEAELWMAAVVDRARPVTHSRGIPEPVSRFEPLVDVILRLKGENGAAHLSILKDHDNPEPAALPLRLDPTTLLLIR